MGKTRTYHEEVAWHDFIAALQRLQSDAFKLGCPIAGKVLNAAINTAGWEYAGEPDAAIEKLRSEFGGPSNG